MFKRGLNHPLDGAALDSLVVTFSNVNKEVVRMNSEVLQLDTVPSYLKMDLSRLDELVGRRNLLAMEVFRQRL